MCQIKRNLIILLWLLPQELFAAPSPDRVNVVLLNQFRIIIRDVEILDAAILPDNESVVVVGSRRLDPKEKVIAVEETSPSGAIANLRTKACSSFTNGHTARILSVCVAGDGSQIITSSSTLDPEVRIWDIRAGKSTGTIKVSKQRERNALVIDHKLATFSNSARFAVTVGESVAIFDSKKKQKILDLTEDSITSSPADLLATSP
jgi:WD40 repeat protein